MIRRFPCVVACRKANARLDQEIEEGFASGAPPGAPAPGLLETLTRPGGADLLDVIRRILRDELSEMIVARRDALPQDRGITVRYLGEKGSETPRLDAEVLLAHTLGCKRIDLYTRHDEPASDDVLTT